MTGAACSYASRSATTVVVLVLLLRRAACWEDRASRVAVWLLAAALSAGILSGVAAGVQIVLTGRPLPPTGAAQWLYLGYAPLTVAALLALPWKRRSSAGVLRAVADALAAGGALSVLALTVSEVSTHGSAGLTTAGVIVTDAHAVLPAVVVATALSVLKQVRDGRRWFVGLLALGMAVLGACDLAYFLTTLGGGYSPTSVIGVLYEAALLLLVACASSVGRRGRPPAIVTRAAVSAAAALGAAVPYLACTVAAAAVVVLGASGYQFTTPQKVSSVLVVLSVMVRQFAQARQLRGAMEEVSVRERLAQDRLRRDELTGLPNRLALSEVLAALSPQPPVAVAMVDVQRGAGGLGAGLGHAPGIGQTRGQSGAGRPVGRPAPHTHTKASPSPGSSLT